MAHCSPIVSSLLVLFLCLAPCAYSDVPNIKDICAKHKNPSYCEQFLNAKEGSSLTCLAEYAIDSAKEKAVIAKVTLGSLIHKTPEIRLKHHYHSCSEHYGDAIDSLSKAREYLDSKDFFGINIAASAALTNIDDCESSEAPGFDPSVDIKKKNEDLENASTVIMILANRLGGRH